MNKLLTQFSILVTLAIPILGFSQASPKHAILGKVMANQQPIEAASISLLSAKDSAIVKMAASDKEGLFELNNVKEGKYLVVVQAVGYLKYAGEGFTISTNSADYQVPVINLLSDKTDLQTVTVVAKKQLVEQKIDRTIINVDASPSNVGISALDVLEKSPGISLDKEGNISLKGKQGVMIMMDGKPTYLGGQDLVNLLKSMPSSNLDQIEIMTNPPAKYDASGNSGVINIKTKKNKIKGFNGSITSGYSQSVYSKTNNSISLNYRSGKFNLFSNFSDNYSKGYGELDILRNFRSLSTASIVSIFDQHAHSDREHNNYSYKLGADYNLSKKTTLGLVVNGFASKGNDIMGNTTLINDANNSLVTRTQSLNDMKQDFKNIGLNFNFRHVFDTAGTELTSDIDYLNYNSNNRQYLGNQSYDNQGIHKGNDELLRGILPSNIDIYSAKIDFTKPLRAGAKFEAGWKSSYVATDNDAQYSNWVVNDFVADASRSNHFLYHENINAAYLNFSKPLSKKWSAQLGLRAENTNLKGNQLTTGEVFTRNYTQLFPTAYIGFNPNEKNQFALSFGRRIARPDYEDLNPFYYFIDKYTYNVGNPYLNPQFSRNIELSHTFKGFLTTTLSYSNTRDIIQDVLEQVDSTNTSFVKKSNIAKQENIGLSVSAGLPVTKWWRTNIYLNLYNNKFKGIVNEGEISVEGTTFMTNISNQLSFKKGWGAELSGFYRSKALEGVLVANPMGVINLTFSKQLLKNKASLKLNFRDLFFLQKFSGYSKYQNVDVTIHAYQDSRMVNLSFTYRFGKGKPAQQPSRRNGAGDEQNRVKSVSNN